MSDRIDPGPGWRLLKDGELKPRGYEWWSVYREAWSEGLNFGEEFKRNMLPCRVRIAPTTTKAIATRATVRVAFSDGVVTDNVMTCDSGLSGKMMGFVIKRWYAVQSAEKIQGAKYIMLEIQREGEP